MTRLLAAQTWIRRNGPPDVRGIELITLEELQEIRRIWVVDKHELEDALPRLYRKVTGEAYPGRLLDDNRALGEPEMRELEELCGDDRLHYELTRELLSLTQQQRTSGRRVGLYDRLEKAFRRHFYADRADAMARARYRADERQRRASECKDRAFSQVTEGAADALELAQGGEGHRIESSPSQKGGLRDSANILDFSMERRP